MKKIIKSLGAISVFVAPLALIISCNNSSRGEDNLKDNDGPQGSTVFPDRFFKPFTFKEIKLLGKNQPNMYRGIGYHAYSHGISFLLNLAKKLGFNIYGDEVSDSTKIDYRYKDGASNIEKTNTQQKAETIYDLFKEYNTKNVKTNTILKNTKNSGGTWIDSAGVDSTMGENQFAHSGYYDPNDIENFKSIFQDAYFSKGIRSKKINNINYKYGVSNFFQFIDGDEPGRVILKMHVRSANYTHSFMGIDEDPEKNNWSFNTHIYSPKNFYQTFTKIPSTNSSKINEFKSLIFNVLKNLNFAFNQPESKSDLATLTKYLHPKIAEFFNFIKSINKKDPKNPMKNINGSDYINFEKQGDINKIKGFINDLNNGSHDLFALEIFARGVTNLPKRYWPSYRYFAGDIAKIQEMKNDSNRGYIVGMANTSESDNLKNWSWGPASNTKDENGEESEFNNESFDPDVSKPYRVSVEKKYSSPKTLILRKGVILPLMGEMISKDIFNKYLLFSQTNKFTSLKTKVAISAISGLQKKGTLATAEQLGITIDIDPKKIKFEIIVPYDPTTGKLEFRVHLSEFWEKGQTSSLKWIIGVETFELKAKDA